MDFSHSDEHISNKVSRMGLWSQGTNNYVDTLGRDQVQGFASAVPSPQVNTAVSCQNYNLQAYGQGAGMHNYEAKYLRELENHLFSDMPGGSYDEKCHMARIASLSALVNFPEEENPANKNGSQQTFYGQSIDADENLVLGGNEHANVIGGQFYQQPVTCMPQICPENPMMYQPWNNNLSYTYVTPDPPMEDFGPAQTVDGNHKWNEDEMPDDRCRK